MAKTLFDRHTMAIVTNEVASDFGIRPQEATLRVQDVLTHRGESAFYRQVGPYVGAAARRVWQRAQRLIALAEKEVDATIQEYAQQGLDLFTRHGAVFTEHPDLVELDALLDRLYG